MTARETVAAALIAKMRDGACEWDKLSETDQEFGLGLADSAFASITLVVAEQGWCMAPVEATEAMLRTANGFNYASPYTMRQDSALMEKYRAMLVDPTAQFEWEK